MTNLERLYEFIAVRDRKLVKAGHWHSNELKKTFDSLIQFGSINVGGRASCGPKVDATWRIYVMWKEVIKKAQALGFHIEVESIKQKNAYATIAGGFWQEDKYILKQDMKEAA